MSVIVIKKGYGNSARIVVVMSARRFRQACAISFNHEYMGTHAYDDDRDLLN